MTDSPFATALLASLVACAVTTVGIFLVAKYHEWSRDRSVYFMSYAAGVLVTTSFMHIIPEALEMSETAPAFVLAGFLGLYLSNHFLKLYVCQDHATEKCVMGLIPVLGIGFHSLVDGAIYAVTFNVSILTGVLAAVGMVLHELPEGMVAFVLLQRGGLARKRAFLWAFAAAAISTPLGFLMAFPVVNAIRGTALGALLGLAAGALIYVGASHLLPEVERKQQKFSLAALAGGVVTAVLIIVLGAGGH